MKTSLYITSLLLSFFLCKAQNLTETDLLNYITMNSDGMYNTQVLQLGNYNTAVIEANQISLTQSGDYQQFYYTETSILPSDLRVNVEGFNNYVEIYGNNQIMDNLTLNIKGDNRTVIIRNYP